MSLLRPGVIKKHKTQTYDRTVHIDAVIFTGATLTNKTWLLKCIESLQLPKMNYEHLGDCPIQM